MRSSGTASVGGQLVGAAHEKWREMEVAAVVAAVWRTLDGTSNLSAMDWLVMAAGYNELFICLISSEDMKGVPLPMSIKQTDIEFTSATTIISAIGETSEVAGATGKPTIDAYKSFIYKGRESAEPFALHMLIRRLANRIIIIVMEE
uniref:Uncharacterized protein n=1 Tax=Oryza nivara TaxID=4536 RepID=A0A0E0II69_ORYNI